MQHDLRTRLSEPRPVLLDGGFATTLEAGGFPLPRPLWSAHALLTAPARVADVHRAFVREGAEVLLTASYQLSSLGLAAEGIESERHDELFERSVGLARSAATDAGHPVWVAGSLGPYGAALADGSEYTGAYDLAPGELRDFHAPRVEALLAAEADLLAVETVPSGSEVETVVELVRGSDLPMSISVTLAGDGTRTPRGEPVDEALGPALETDEVIAVGVNCCPPDLVAPALGTLAGERARGRALLAKPNAGARWDPATKTWQHDGEVTDPDPWLEAGAHLIGGCCGTSPSDLAALADHLGGPPVDV